MDRSLWDAIARVERRHWWFQGRREIVSRILERRIPAGSRVLDIGCGTGFVIERLAERFDAIGLEPDASVRDRAHPSLNARILPGGTDDLTGVTGRRFDALLLLDVLEHLDDDAAALRAIRPHFAPGGVLLVMVPANPRLWSRHDELNQHRRRYDPDRLAGILEAAGYAIEHLGYMNSRLYPLAWAHRLIATDTNAALRVPPAPFNRLFAMLFAGEARRKVPGYRRGLSLLALAHPTENSR